MGVCSRSLLPARPLARPVNGSRRRRRGVRHHARPGRLARRPLGVVLRRRVVRGHRAVRPRRRSRTPGASIWARPRVRPRRRLVRRGACRSLAVERVHHHRFPATSCCSDVSSYSSDGRRRHRGQGHEPAPRVDGVLTALDARAGRARQLVRARRSPRRRIGPPQRTSSEAHFPPSPPRSSYRATTAQMWSSLDHLQTLFLAELALKSEKQYRPGYTHRLECFITRHALDDLVQIIAYA